MQHIRTTATTVRKIKASAKTIRTEAGIPLGQALDRAALAAGYIDFHHVSACAKKTLADEKLKFQGLGKLQFIIDQVPSQWEIYEEKGNVSNRLKRYAGQFDLLDAPESIDQVDEELWDVSESVGGGMGDMTLIPASGLKKLVNTSKTLIKREPAFLDGYAHGVGALSTLGKPKEAVDFGVEAYQAAVTLIPNSFRGYIPYACLTNRPFHRLAINLVIAYDQLRMTKEAIDIAEQMLKWWPNDNIGFRYVLHDLKLHGCIQTED